MPGQSFPIWTTSHPKNKYLMDINIFKFLTSEENIGDYLCKLVLQKGFKIIKGAESITSLLNENDHLLKKTTLKM